MDIAQRPAHPPGDHRGADSPRFGTPSLAAVLANGTLFNLSWLAIVLTHSALLGPIVVLLHLAVHFRFFGYGITEAKYILLVAVVGLLLDQFLFLAGVLTTTGGAFPAPLWLSCLWPVLATTMMHAFSGLQARPVLAALFGAVGGALSYTAGTRLSDVEFVSAFWSPVTLAIAWALLFPALLAAARWMSNPGREHR